MAIVYPVTKVDMPTVDECFEHYTWEKQERLPELSIYLRHHATVGVSRSTIPRWFDFIFKVEAC